jgi:hypothetical protein
MHHIIKRSSNAHHYGEPCLLNAMFCGILYFMSVELLSNQMRDYADTLIESTAYSPYPPPANLEELKHMSQPYQVHWPKTGPVLFTLQSQQVFV